MILATYLNLTIPKASISAESAYAITAELIQAFTEIHSGLSTWSDLPRSPKDKGVLFADKEAVLERMRQDTERRMKEYEGLPHADGANLLLSTSLSQKTWLKPGHADLDYNPITGHAAFRLYKPEPFFGEQTALVVRNVLLMLADRLGPTFAHGDVKVKLPDGGHTSYQFGPHLLYDHREFLGWMGFVPQVLQPEHLRDAHEVIPVGDKGTVIVSVPGVFNPADAAQVRKVHNVEMQLAHYNLLPVTDPSLL